jgi:Asp-tRNA(Asn)/Glu-tRNA(Gln) amidotransferase B subunit
MIEQSTLATIIDDVIASNPDQVKRYRDGKKSTSGFFVGNVMRKTSNLADPAMVMRLVTEKLDQDCG